MGCICYHSTQKPHFDAKNSSLLSTYSYEILFHAISTLLVLFFHSLSNSLHDFDNNIIIHTIHFIENFCFYFCIQPFRNRSTFCARFSKVFLYYINAFLNHRWYFSLSLILYYRKLKLFDILCSYRFCFQLTKSTTSSI